MIRSRVMLVMTSLLAAAVLMSLMAARVTTQTPSKVSDLASRHQLQPMEQVRLITAWSMSPSQALRT